MTRTSPYLLSGGSGTRLWPLSRRACPKQFLPLTGERTLFQQTCARVSAPLFSAPTILCSGEHRFIVAEQLREIGISPEAIVLEPVARNTAPAAAVASLMTARDDENGLVLLLPSDHVMADREGFADAVETATAAAQDGALVTFGVVPDRPHTGYGYIETGGGVGPAQPVSRFVEKPSREVAEGYLADGRFLWNAGLFLFSAKAMIEAFERHAPDTLSACREALGNARADLDFLRLDENAYGRAENISLDYAIMEKAANLRCVSLSGGWSDLGSWPALWRLLDKDEDGNAGQGDVTFHDARDSYAYSDGALVSVLGLRDVVVVATADAVLVASRERAQAVRELVARLEAQGREETVHHARVYRPWGWYQGIARGERFQVKCIMVSPGARLSLQKHRHRAEHWVVVRGTLEVTVGERVELLSENQSVYIPLGERHRMANPGEAPALLIEVQSGSYLGEDDIVRFEDDYGRG